MSEVPKIVRERLKATESRQAHPDPDVLTAFAENSLPDRERATVLDHISRCGDCRDVIALALPPKETLATPQPHRRSSWFTWPALRWGLAAAGVIVVASVGIVRYQKNSRLAEMSKVSVQLEAPRTEAKAEIPAPPATENKGFASNASAPSANSPAALPKIAAPAEPKRDQPVRHDSARVAGNLGGPPPSTGPRFAFQQQVSGQRTAPAQNQQFFDKLQRGRELSSSQPASPTLEARAQVGAGQGGGIGAGVDSKQLDYSKAKEPVPAAPTASGDNQAQDEWALLKNGTKALPGQMGGYVIDPSGAAVGNAQITLTPSIGGSATTLTDSQGRWLIAGLPSGNYQARAQAPGFQTTSRNFTYDASRPSMYVFPLNIGSASETVEVSSQSPAIQAETGAVGSTVTGAQVAQLPINSRNLTTLATLARWTIGPTGELQRSLDGKTWQDVDVIAGLASAANFTSVDATAETVMVTGAPAPAKAKDTKKTRKRESTAPLTFRAVTANGPEVWAGGSPSALFHTSDGGMHWTRILPSSGGIILTGDVIGLEFSDPQHGAVTTSASEVWTTADAGQTWQKQ